MSGEEIGKLLLDAHNVIFPKSFPGNVFAGGNVGLVAIAVSISEHAKALNNLAEAISKVYNVDKPSPEQEKFNDNLRKSNGY